MELRQSFGKVLGRLQRTGEPILVEKRGKPVAALISLKDFRERFSEKNAAVERERLFARMDEIVASAPSIDPTPGLQILRELRGYED